MLGKSDEFLEKLQRRKCHFQSNVEDGKIPADGQKRMEKQKRFLLRIRNVMCDEEEEQEADQVHVEGDRGRDVRPVLQVAKEAHGNVQAAERGGDKIDGDIHRW